MVRCMSYARQHWKNTWSLDPPLDKLTTPSSPKDTLNPIPFLLYPVISVIVLDFRYWLHSMNSLIRSFLLILPRIVPAVYTRPNLLNLSDTITRRAMQR
jgi:hypothetical protein